MSNRAVRLMHYDPRWRQEFEQTRSSILQSCQGWVVAVEHVGSTSIDGLVARPTIDMLAGVTSTQARDAAAELIEGLNFGYTDSVEWAPEAVVMQKPRRTTSGEPNPTHRLFLMPQGGQSWDRALRVRDWLRQHREDAIRFEEAKVQRWKSGEGELERYLSDKAIFFSHLEDQIEAADLD